MSKLTYTDCLADMVDRQKIELCLESLEPRPTIFTGCDKRIASAVKRIQNQWKPYTARSRRYSLYRLLEETIDPAWRDYIASLPDDDICHVLGRRFIFSSTAKLRGFSFVDRRLRNLSRLVARSRKKQVRQSWPPMSAKKLRKAPIPTPSDSDIVFNQTISTLRDLALHCELKLPSRTLIGGLNARRSKSLCELCGDKTELARVLAGAFIAAADSARFSARFCSRHRPMLHDQTWNPEYKSAKRSSRLFDRLVFLLKRHTINIDSFEFVQRQGIGVPFLWELGHRQDLTSLDTTPIRKLARELADSKMSERKATIVRYAEAGLSQSEIARRLGISRQAISKFMNSDSFKKLAAIYRRRA